MDKEKIDLLKAVVGLFGKAKFDLTGAEMVNNAKIMLAFGKLIVELENGQSK